MVTTPITVSLGPGLNKNGTSYKRKGMYTDANLVRWHDGSIRPIGGWGRRTNSAGSVLAAVPTTPADEVVRNLFAWRDLANAQHLFAATNANAFHLALDGTKTDITPVGFVATDEDAITYSGFGRGGFGYGAFGVTYDMVGRTPTPPARWYASNYGEILIYGARENKSVISECDPGTPAAVTVTNSPSGANDLVVTKERQILAVGTDGEGRRVRSSDIEDRTVWAPASSNQCIDRTLRGEGDLLRVVNALDTVLILGEKDVHIAEYINAPYVYSINPIGNNCGLICADALAVSSDFAVWWSERSFWMFDGQLQELPCSVIDYLYEDMNVDQRGKISAFANPEYSEIWWLYQSTSSSEVDSYVYWNHAKNHWNVGRIDRTAGLEKGVFQFQIMADSDGLLYNHELEHILPSGSVYVKTGILEMADGQKELCVHDIFPDSEDVNSPVTYTLTAQQLPDLSEITFGPYSYANPVNTTGVAGRGIKLRVDFIKAKAEHGDCRLMVTPGGGRG